MNKFKKNELQEKANILKALSHPTRIFILEELKKRKCSVSELRDMIGVDMSTVSKHLSILKNSGIIRDNKLGLNVFYEINICCVIDFLKCAEKVIKQNIKRKLRVA